MLGYVTVVLPMEVFWISFYFRLCQRNDTNGGALDLIMYKAMIVVTALKLIMFKAMSE